MPKHPVRATLAASLFLSTLFVACAGGGGRAATDGASVKAGQDSWCESIAKTRGKDASWDKMAECKAFKTTASGAYLKAMGTCYAGKVEVGGKDQPDDQKLVTDCQDDAMVRVPAPGSLDVDIFQARCERQKRCEKVEVADCKMSLDKLQANQKAVLSTQYNESAQQEIADCLRSEGCSSNEDETKAKCYDKANPKMLWFP